VSRFRGPIWRVAGSFVSWFLFALSFSLLYQGSAVVMGLGGFCASGGPYVIETECPDAVVAYVPLSIFGGLIAVAIGALFAQGFGTPLLTWAWSILFVGLGVAFLMASAQPGGITFLIIGIMFVLMGLVPLIIWIRASVQGMFLGTTNAFDVKFEATDTGRRGLMGLRSFGVEESDERVAPTAGDWALALGVLVVAVGLGVYLAGLMFAAASTPVPQ
jgi:hypothetical protein